MRILVLSDSHGSEFAVKQAILAQPTARALFHVGDGERDLEPFLSILGDMPVFRVKGNCDFASNEPESRLEMLAGKRIFCAHGHTLYVKYTPEKIIEEARSQRADIILYGHTHTPVTDYIDGLYVMNPGSVREGSYGVIDISAQGIVCINMRLPY